LLIHSRTAQPLKTEGADRHQMVLSALQDET
jgi:hypothetical protein